MSGGRAPLGSGGTVGAPLVVLVTGRDPSQGMGGGSSYVRAHARAARLAGFEPHIFCLAAPGHRRTREDRESVATAESTDFGVVHRVTSSLGPFDRWLGSGQPPEQRVVHWFNALAHSPYMVPVHGRRLADAIAGFLRDRPGPHLVHGFYTWGWVGLRVRQLLDRLSPSEAVRAEAVPIVSCFTLAVDECRAKVWGASPGDMRTDRLLAHLELLWVRLLVARYERCTYRGSRLVLVNYDAVCRRLVQRFGSCLPLHHLSYAPDSAFLHAGEPPPAAPPLARAPTIVSVSRHDPRKGVAVLLHALALLQARGVPFQAQLLSGGPLLAMHRALAVALGLGAHVLLPGWVDDAYTPLRGADIFVLPSLQEGSGSISMLEAMQAGRAIVATDVDGLGEDVRDGDSALLVPAGDPMALAAALERLIADHALRTRLAARARTVWEERFSAKPFSVALGGAYLAALGAG